jgi:hypothetical protein
MPTEEIYETSLIAAPLLFGYHPTNGKKRPMFEPRGYVMARVIVNSDREDSGRHDAA